MALITAPWQISKEDMDRMLAQPMPSIRDSFITQLIEAERRYLDEGIRRALGLWVSELEPELMYRSGHTRPFGITARGHLTPYIWIKWDETYHFQRDGEQWT